jgi:hypothetical protein
MIKQPYCRHCSHPAHRADCGVDDCGCVRYTPRPPRDEARLRTWIVTGAFFVKNRWLEAEVRVKAGGLVGAITKGVREAKRQALKPRTRVAQTKVTVVPVAGRK